jgi:LruC domain-containing protein
MKPEKMLPTVAVLMAVLVSCSLDNPWSGSSSGGAASLPPDVVHDVARSYSEFTYETLLPVTLDLTVTLYDSSPASRSLESLPAEGELVIVSLKNANGKLVYVGRASEAGTLEAVVPLPAAPEDMELTLEAPGFSSRTVTIQDMVELAEVNREMGLMADDMAPKGEDLVDTDEDGIPDVYDAYPSDPDVAFTVRNPAEGSLTVAYEDLFPVPGDADYNDFVAKYFVVENYKNVDTETELEKEKEIIKIIEKEKDISKKTKLGSLYGEAKAVDKVAGYNHRFGLVIDFPGLTADLLEISYYDGSGVQQSATYDSVEDQAVIWLFENTKYAKDNTASFFLHFPSAVDRDRVSYAPFDPVLQVTSNGSSKAYDIHLIGEDPLPGTVNPAVPEDFIDDNGFPWALLVPDDWEHPAETQYIGQAYPLFDAWRTSSGESFGYWYLYPASTNTEPGNNPPALVVDGSGARAVSPEYLAGAGDLQYFQLQFAADPPDPDGDVVYFRSSLPPDGLAGKMLLNATTGKVTFAEGVEVDDYLVYFWSEDEHGASTIADPLKVTFRFRTKTINTPPVVTFSADPFLGTPSIGATLAVQYTYSDADGDAQDLDATTYVWLRYDDATATTGTVIPGASGPSYTTTEADSGKWLRVQVTPADVRGAVGAATLSQAVQVYTRIVIDTFAPSGGGTSDTILWLIDGSGSFLAEDENGNPDQQTHDGYSRIGVEQLPGGLPAGTYYVRVTNPTATGSMYYGIRVANYDPGDSFPILGNTSENDGESDDFVDAATGVPTNPLEIEGFGDDYALSRALFPVAIDVDWMFFEVP